MKLSELQLIAYGPFTDAKLDLAGDAGMHVIYGPNEAGKSTALRAITGLLYGIPARTGDAHVHPMKRLRIGGVLQLADGEKLRIVRRKGLKRTLLDPDDKPMDEALLTRALGGVSRSLFVTMFGLDHVTLREGAQALLRGGGDLGESLFDAGGARGIGKVLDGLRAEADALYKPRGQTPKVNDALRQLKEAKQAIFMKEMLPAAWSKQKAATVEARQEYEKLVEERQRIGRERGRVQRALRAFPNLVRRSEAQRKLDGLGEVPRMPPDARERRVAAEKRRDIALRRAAQLRVELTTLETERDALVVDAGLVALTDEATRDISDRLGNHKKALVDLPKREAAWRARRREAEELTRELGDTLTLEDVAKLRLSKPTRARLDALRSVFARHEAELEAATRERDEARAHLDSVVKRRSSLDTAGDVEALRRVHKRVARDGDLDEELGASAAVEEDLVAQLEGLERLTGGLVTPPSMASVERQATHRLELREALARNRENERQRRERADEVATRLEELAHLGAPSPAALADARADREAHWVEITADVASATPEMIAAFEQAARVADDCADQLWQQADRAARNAQLLAERSSLERATDEATRERAELEAAEMKADVAWNALFEGLAPGHLPEDAAEANRLLDACERRETVRASLRSHHAAVADTTRRIAAHREALTPWVGAEGTLVELVERAEVRIAREEELRRRDESLREKVAEAEEMLAVRDARVTEKVRALTAWRQEWAQAVAVLGLAAEATVEEVAAVEVVLSDLNTRLREAGELERRIEGMRRDAAQFSEIVTPLIEAHAAEAMTEPLDRAAETLLARHREHRVAAARRDSLAEEIAARKEELVASDAEVAVAEGELAELKRLAGVSDIADLERVEQRADLKRQQLSIVERAEEALYAEGSIEELVAMTQDLDVDAARERAQQLDEEHRDVIDKCERLSATIGANERGLEELEQKDGAAVAAASREEVQASIARHAARYGRVKLATTLLEREIDRYRQHHQGPILARAGEIFPKLTLGRYASLTVGFDDRDEPALRCTRADGAEVEVQALSDGTRDQLYLALRLASLERYAQQSQLLPFVVDDVLIHFDDDRARAALEVLVAFSQQTQVLFFTHHQRLVDLASELSDSDVASRLGAPPVRHHRLADPAR